VPWSSRISQALAALDTAVDAGLIAGAAVLQDAVKEKLRGGYTSGQFVTGANVNSVIVVGPTTSSGAREARVTTRLTNPPYPWWWEVGHLNLWVSDAPMGPQVGVKASSVGTKRQGTFVRVEKWRPAAEESADRVASTFASVTATTFSQRMGTAALPGRGGAR
jgi:hypothetical protein